MSEIAEALHNLIALARPYMLDHTQVLGLKEAEAALQAARAASEPPSPPAWMVEVAREAVRDERGVTAKEIAIRTLRLALERGHVLDPDAAEPRTVRSGGLLNQWVVDLAKLVERQRPTSYFHAAHRAIELAAADGCIRSFPALTEDQLLKKSREDVASVLEARGSPDEAEATRTGKRDHFRDMECALQARRNMLREWAVAVPTKVPEVDRDGMSPAYATGDRVQKTTGDYQIGGIVRGVILTGAGLWRYAVEHKAEGGGAFLHIYAGANLSTLPTREA